MFKGYLWLRINRIITMSDVDIEGKSVKVITESSL
ncbi:hypothetical protein SPAB_02791 [Salmonella enterica subsp. enterica serovar Paratyphi B str. SPB7]|uniref:Uncharacterized protein n=1 Tax=Salmonella paratyphi B (strain ATCC BAA-1250 / SPB7) TaxID=1016998 RepID=A0A6C6Z3D9_SALPB|nr:hypothetical protein SPAB_02791 [Salmonella enterica subsp. enterica serovar Paratyphi B str. SPB7]